MEALKFESFPIHLEGLSDITLNHNTSEIISGGNDCILKIFNIKEKSCKQSYDVVDEIRAIDFSSSKQMLAYSQSSSVYLVSNMNSLSNSSLITSFISPITKIYFYDNLDCIISISEDDDIHFTNISSLCTYKHKTHHEGSIKDFSVSNAKGLLVTSGCDGNVIIVDINNIFEYNILRKIKVNAKVSFENVQRLGLSINEDNICAIAGSILLKTIDLNNTDYKLNTESQISHKNDISLVRWISSKFLATMDISNNIKIWNYQGKSLISSYDHNESIIRLEFDKLLKQLVFIDKQGSLNISQTLELKERLGNKIYDKVPETTNKLLKININKENEDICGNVTSAINEMIEKKKNEEDVEMDLNLSEIEDENGDIKPKEQIEEKIIEKKQAVIMSKADMIIECMPQEAFISGSTDFSSTQARFLCWNMIGTLTLREQIDMSYIEIDFSNPLNKTKKFFPNIYNMTMGVMNNCGAFLACKGEEENLDEYEKDKKKLSVIEFKPFYSWANIKEWKKEFQLGENVENLAIGVDWCAVFTDNFFIRVFTHSGIESFIFSVPNQVICMAGYENLLAYVYTVSPPLYGTQNLRFKIVDVNNNYEDIIDDQLPISSYSTLSWFGFSEDGMLLTVDSEKVVRGFSFKFGKKWIPLLVLRDIYQGSVWIIGAQEEEIYVVDLKGSTQPVPFQKHPIKVHKYKIPILSEPQNVKGESSKDDERILNNLMFINHDIWRLNNYKIFKDARSTQNADHYYSDNLREEDEIRDRKKIHDRMILTLINESIIEKKLGMAESLFSFLTIPKSKVLCLNMCQQLNQTKLLESLNRKLMIENFKESQKTTNQISEKTNDNVGNVNQINKNNSHETAESLFSQISVNIDMYRSVVEEEANKNNIINNNVKIEDYVPNTQNTYANNQSKEKVNGIENNVDKKINNPFIKGEKSDTSKQKNIFEDLSKVTNSQNNAKIEKDIQNFSQKIGFKRKTNSNGEEKNKIDSQLQNSKIKK